jgi:hypothetical protein
VSIFVFVGSSLPVSEARHTLDAIYLPPAKTGDVYRAALHKPQAIALIDGYFDQVPTVWHKEILWAMAQGIHVFGSSSMGALRAAELHAFGMEGIGQIFEAFLSEVLEDDDEVAVAHAQAEADFMALSVAMVDIRATVQHALAADIIDKSLHDALLSAAKGLHYSQRNHPAMIAAVRQQGISNAQLDSFEAWFPDNRIHLKRLDAIELLQTLKSRFSTPQAAKEVAFHFETSLHWHNFVKQAGTLSIQPDTPQPVHLSADWLLDELRLNPQAYYHVFRLTLLQLAAVRIAQSEGWSLPAQSDNGMVGDYQQQMGMSPEQFTAWLSQNDLTPDQLEAVLVDYSRIAQLQAEWYARVLDALPDVLRLSGNYASLARRATRKQSLLTEHYLQTPDMRDTGLDETGLYQWYFCERLQQSAVPADISTHIKQAGFESSEHFKRALIREYCYTTHKQKISS